MIVSDDEESYSDDYDDRYFCETYSDDDDDDDENFVEYFRDKARFWSEEAKSKFRHYRTALKSGERGKADHYYDAVKSCRKFMKEANDIAETQNINKILLTDVYTAPISHAPSSIDRLTVTLVGPAQSSVVTSNF